MGIYGHLERHIIMDTGHMDMDPKHINSNIDRYIIMYPRQVYSYI